MRVKHVYRIKRAGEDENFTRIIGNQRKLLHGSRVSNMVGIVSRGLLEPKRIIASGGKVSVLFA